MKIRNGFVSNSSSSSFICLECGNEYSGRDISICDSDMYECQQGHVFCKDHLDFTLDDLNIEIEDTEEARKELIRFSEANNLPIPLSILNDKYFSAYKLGELTSAYDFPSEWCPYCQMKDISADDFLAYTLKHTTVEDIMLKLRHEFGDYTNFKKYIK